MNWMYIASIIIIVIFFIYFYYVAHYETNFPYDPSMGNCKYRRWGCCPDDITEKQDSFGSNCYPKIKNSHH